jgi:hypothetical protein
MNRELKMNSAVILSKFVSDNNDQNRTVRIFLIYEWFYLDNTSWYSFPILMIK